MVLLGGPERIESGWWDSGEQRGERLRPSDPAPGDVRRDYFLARSPPGELCWIFRDATGWWLQGIGLVDPLAVPLS